MSIVYFYAGVEYNSESDAQAAATAFSIRLQNNPTDWMKVKYITGSNETGWEMNPTLLIDAEILNPDTNKIYSCCSKIYGTNEMPLTGSQVATKRVEYRTQYAQGLEADTIHKVEYDVEKPSVTEITPTTDMSGYV